MKGYVVYDSILGNTKRVAERIAIDLKGKGHEVQMVNLSEREAQGLVGDFLFVGSPNRFKRATKLVKRYVKSLDKEAWKGRPIAAFNTVMKQSDDPKLTEKQKAKAMKWSYEGAAPKLRNILLKKGLQVRQDVLHVEVAGLKDPLVEGWEAKVDAYLKDFPAA